MPIQVQIITAFLILRDRMDDAVASGPGGPRRADRECDLPRRARGRGGRRRGDHRDQAALERREGARLTPASRRLHGDDGLVASVIVLPALLLAFWLVIQYAVAAHVRHVALAAAQDAAIAAAAGGDWNAAADNDLAGVASMTSGVTVSPPTAAATRWS